MHHVDREHDYHTRVFCLCVHTMFSRLMLHRRFFETWTTVKMALNPASHNMGSCSTGKLQTGMTR